MNILASLDRGDTNVFTLQEETPEGLSSPALVSVFWSQEDFFRISQVLHEQSWQEPLGDQNLYNISFNMGCAYVDRGAFSEAEFLSFDIIESGEEEIRVQHRIRIIPSSNLVYTSKAEYRPNIKNLQPINLSKYKISAEAALRIAEKNGGADKRIEFDNNCRISALAPGPDAKGWRVLYQINKDNWWNLFFEISIDPWTGASKVLVNKD
jgi:hypothetical protein